MIIVPADKKFLFFRMGIIEEEMYFISKILPIPGSVLPIIQVCKKPQN